MSENKYKNISYKKGNLLDAEEPYIAHGCNCFSTMGAGVAKVIREKWPEVYEVDKAADIVPPIQKLGNFTFASVDNKIIFNLYTQYQPGSNFELCALKASLPGLIKAIPQNSTVAIPRIGCGIGGGNWEEVEKVLSLFSGYINFMVYDLE